MRLQVKRQYDDGATTVGILCINGLPACNTLEDTRRDEKIRGQTRIPEGKYNITLRKSGGFHSKYSLAGWVKRIHRGMLWVRDVPKFEYILIHTGNHNGHTMGCLLLGDGFPVYKQGRLFMGSSRKAYKRVYPRIAKALAKGETVSIEYVDSAGEYGQSVLA